MADNTRLNKAEIDGDIIATDEIGGIKYQRVKLIHGDDGENDGDVSNANPLPVADPGLLYASGAVSGVTAFRKFGANAAIGATETYVGTVGGSAPHMPTTATTVEAVSGDAADDSAGAGARKILVFGVNDSWTEVSEEITLDGATPTAATTASFFRVYRAYVTETGTYRGSNAGALTVRASGAGASFAVVAIGQGQTQGTHYTVPAGYSLYVTEVHITVNSTKAVNLTLWQAPNAHDVTTPYGGAKRVVQAYSGMTGSQDFEYHPAMKFSAYTDIWVSGTSSGGGGGASVEYIGYLVAE